jgi:uncharacterized protein (DUF58 family)
MSPTGHLATPDQILRRLEWRVLRRLDGRVQGDYRTSLQGHGIDVADLREYEYGDDVRHIDWNVSARMDTPYVRTYLEDRELTAWLLLDRTPSMTFGLSERPKELVLLELATAFARIFTRGGNLVGAILFNNAVEQTIPPRNGRNHVLRIAQALLKPVASSGAETKLSDLLEAANRTIKRRSLVIIVSDFISEPGWERSLSVLSRRHEVVAIHLSDPQEGELPDVGLIVVEDVETGELLSVDTSDQEFRSRFRDAAQKRDADLRAAASQAQVELHPVSTDDDLVRALLRIVELRRRKRR